MATYFVLTDTHGVVCVDQTGDIDSNRSPEWVAERLVERYPEIIYFVHPDPFA